jgi:excisionase family DNA binding protein
MHQNKPSSPRGLLTVKESAQEFGVHENSIRNWILEGRLKAVRIGAHIVRIEAAELAKLSTPYVGGEHSVWNS